MKTICPYCKEDLRIEMTAQWVEKVDPSIVEIYSEELERTQKRASAQGGMIGGMMQMAAGMAKQMQASMVQMMKGMVEYPPMITILKCINCDAVISVSLPSSGKSD